ncbi:HipA-like protein [Verrucomicrobia bacterium]|nr:HipA-like protein [Verrucomicrobiota bacterium]
MNREIEVHVDLDGQPHLVGRLWSRVSKGREGASFAYDPAWLASPLRFPLEPALSLDPGSHHTREGRSLFGALGDSAPDRWGRMLMKRMERRIAEREGRSPRTLLEIDFLLMVDDAIRPGALRFKEAGSERFLASGGLRIPPLVYLSKLLAASDRVLADKESDEDLRLLLAPGSSLGGARPKAAVTDSKGHLHIAKFPHGQDEYSVERWSYLAHTLAGKAGINVASNRILQVDKRSVLLVSRFDRKGPVRIPFLSAMSMLGAADGETHSYLELVDALRQYGADSDADQRELWKRVLFSILISNVDDHLRNHGFLYDTAKRGWRLSPAYDLNPVPRDVKPPFLSTFIDEKDNAASFELVLGTAQYYGLSPADVRQIVKEIVTAVTGWRKTAAQLGISKKETDRMASAFEHEATDAARAFAK